MTTSRADELLRKRDQPPRPTFLELFFDLAFAFGLSRVSALLVVDLVVGGRSPLVEFGGTLLLLLAMLMVWFATAWLTNLYDPGRPEIQLVVAGTMLGSLLMALALPQAFGKHGLPFAIPYVAIHLGRGLVMLPALRGRVEQRRAAGVLLWFAVSAAPWIVGAILPEGRREALWALALAIDYTGAVLLWPAPWSGRGPERWPVAGEYLSGRYRQFFTIALGELIVVAGTTYSVKYYGASGGRTSAFFVSFATTVLLWRIYTHRVGEMLPAALGKSAEAGRVARRALPAHLVMVVAIVTTAAGSQVLIDYPQRHPAPAWIAVILGGPALFIVGRGALERAEFASNPRDRMIGLLVLIGLGPVMLLVPTLAAASTATAVLAGIVIADAVHGRRRPADVPSRQSGRSQ